MEIHWLLRTFCTFALALGLVVWRLTVRYPSSTFVGTRCYWCLLVVGSLLAGFLLAEATLTPWLDAVCQLGYLFNDRWGRLGVHGIAALVGSAAGYYIFSSKQDSAPERNVRMVLGSCVGLVLCFAGSVIAIEGIEPGYLYLDSAGVVRYRGDTQRKQDYLRFDRAFWNLRRCEVGLKIYPVVYSVGAGNQRCSVHVIVQRDGTDQAAVAFYRQFGIGSFVQSRLDTFVQTLTAPTAEWRIEQDRPAGITAERQRAFGSALTTLLTPALTPHGLTPIAAWYEPNP